MIMMGDRVAALEKQLNDVTAKLEGVLKNMSAHVRSGIEQFVAEEKAKHDAPEPKDMCMCEDPSDQGVTHCKDKPCFTTPAPEDAAPVPDALAATAAPAQEVIPSKES